VGSKRVSTELTGSATRLRQRYVVAGIEGKVARVATSKLGNERMEPRGPERHRWANRQVEMGGST
jgi:hypothetical protein